MKALLLSFLFIALLCGCGRTTDEDARAIESNLRHLSDAANQFMLQHGKQEARFDDLVGDKATHFIRQVKAVNGESYEALVFTAGTKSVSVSTKDGREITYRIP